MSSKRARPIASGEKPPVCWVLLSRSLPKLGALSLNYSTLALSTRTIVVYIYRNSLFHKHKHHFIMPSLHHFIHCRFIAFQSVVSSFHRFIVSSFRDLRTVSLAHEAAVRDPLRRHSGGLPSRPNKRNPLACKSTLVMLRGNHTI